MAKVLNSPMGQLSGRVGGFVFTSNKSGSVVRSGTIPTNPQTQVQTRQRTLFGAVSKIFRTITGAQRTLWQEFADNYFNPRNGTNQGQFSGYNAFTALRNVVQQAYRLPLTNLLLAGAPGGQLVFTQDVFTPMPSAPIPKGFTPVLVDATSQLHSLTLTSAILHQDGYGSFDLQVGDGAGHNFTNLKTPESYNIGYIIYLSNGNPAPNLTYGNRFANTLGYIAPFEVPNTTNQLDGLESLTVDWSDTYDYAQAKRFPIAGEYALLSVFAVNLYGQLAEIDNIEVQMTA